MRQYRVARGTVSNILRRHGVATRPMRRLRVAEQTRLIRDYRNRHSMSILAKRYRVSLGTVWRVLRRHKVRSRSLIIACRQRRLDESAFDRITEASAYWIGFLMADGSIEARGRGYGSPVLTLTVAVRDVDHLKAFRRFLGSNHHVTRSRKEVKIAVASARLVQKIGRYGVIPRKAKRSRVIGLSRNRHFWRGVIDGDGSLIIERPTRTFPGGFPILILYGSESLLEQFRVFIRRVWPAYNGRVMQRTGCCRITLKGNAAFHAIQVLYARSSVALPRKLERAGRLTQKSPVPQST